MLLKRWRIDWPDLADPLLLVTSNLSLFPSGVSCFVIPFNALKVSYVITTSVCMPSIVVQFALFFIFPIVVDHRRCRIISSLFLSLSLSLSQSLWSVFLFPPLVAVVVLRSFRVHIKHVVCFPLPILFVAILFQSLQQTVNCCTTLSLSV